MRLEACAESHRRRGEPADPLPGLRFRHHGDQGSVVPHRGDDRLTDLLRWVASGAIQRRDPLAELALLPDAESHHLGAGNQVGAHQPRTDRAHADPVAHQFRPQAVREHQYRGLARRVGDEAFLWGERGRRRDVHDVPAGAALEHLVPERPAPVHHTPEVDVHDVLERLLRCAGEGADHGDAGVVDEHVRHAVLGADRRGEPPHLLLVGDVEFVRVRATAVHRSGAAGLGVGRVEHLGGLAGGVEVAVGDHDDRPHVGEGPGRRTADAAARPGDHGERPGQVVQALMYHCPCAPSAHLRDPRSHGLHLPRPGRSCTASARGTVER